MSTLDLTPAAIAAPRVQRIWRHALMETKLIVRNGEQVLLALVIPVGLLAVHAAAGARLGIPREEFAASVVALGLWSTGFTMLAVATGFERRYGVLERLAATPLRRVDLLAGKALSVTMVALGQGGILVVAALLSGWSPSPSAGQTVIAIVATILGLLAFAALGLALAGAATAELTLALANLIYLAGATLGIVLPSGSFPEWAQPILSLLPTTALADTLRTWAAGGTDPLPLTVLAGWAVLGLAVARKGFRWTS